MILDGWGIAKTGNGKLILEQEVGEIRFSRLNLKGLNKSFAFERQIVLTKGKPFEVSIND